MGKPVLLVTDISSHGGIITPKGDTFTVGMVEVALVGYEVICPHCPNNNGNSLVTKIETSPALQLTRHGIQVATVGSICAAPCGAIFEKSVDVRLSAS